MTALQMYEYNSANKGILAMAAPKQDAPHAGGDWKAVPGMPAFLWSVIETSQWEFDGHKATIHPVWNLHTFWTPATVRMGNEPGPGLVLPAGSLILIPPHTWFRVITSYRGTPGHHAWSHFTTENQEVLDAMVKASPFGFIRYRDSNKTVRERMRAMARLASDDRLGNFWSIQKIIGEVLDLLRGARPARPGWYTIATATGGATDDPIVASALRYMSLHLADSVTVDSMARDLHVSVSTLAHRFRSGAREAPMQALRRLRLLRAKTLISGGATLDVVAEQTGFFDRQHLAREFKRSEGCTPGAFRRGSRR